MLDTPVPPDALQMAMIRLRCRMSFVEEAAERMRTKPRFIRRLIAERRIEYVKLGRHVRISEPALAAFIAAGRVQPLAPPDVWPQIRPVA
jgi:excisionase family DNA binding protein